MEDVSLYLLNIPLIINGFGSKNNYYRAGFWCILFVESMDHVCRPAIFGVQGRRTTRGDGMHSTKLQVPVRYQLRAGGV